MKQKPVTRFFPVQQLSPNLQLRLWGVALTLTLTVTDTLSVLSGSSLDLTRLGIAFLQFAIMYMLLSMVICQLALTPFLDAGTSAFRRILTTATAVIANAGAEAFSYWLALRPDAMNSVEGIRDASLFSLLATAGPRVALWLAVMLVLLHQRNRQQAQDRVRSLEAAVNQARLSRLETQINPHFLFNALNTVSALIRLDRKSDAIGAVTALGDLLRRSLEHDASPLAPLSDEIESAAIYLQIEALRFPERLHTEWEIDDRFQAVLIPRFTLQTLLENVVKHGVSRTDALVTATIRVTEGPESTCWVCVRNDRYVAPAPAPGRPGGTGGIGIANLQQRAAILFPHVGELTCGPAGGDVFECRLRVPVSPGAEA
jgi:histidine kinase